MKLTSDIVKKVAKLGNLSLDESEIPIYAAQLSKVLEYVEKLDQVDTSKTSPLFNPSNRSQITREDKPNSGLSQKEALSNGSNVNDGYFITKGVFDDE